MDAATLKPTARAKTHRRLVRTPKISILPSPQTLSTHHLGFRKTVTRFELHIDSGYKHTCGFVCSLLAAGIDFGAMPGGGAGRDVFGELGAPPTDLREK